MAAHRFVSLRPDGSPVHLFDDKKKKIREVIWGDFLKVKKDLGDGWLEIWPSAQGRSPETGGSDAELVGGIGQRIHAPSVDYDGTSWMHF
ncbi:hypothetical protein [Variovorax paradoxus]|uniref:hypothetical protein n=1 Tax=Variovorax paradoxus TaxID=34073 RepID=UPI003D656630